MANPTNPNVTFNTIGQIGINFTKRTNTTTETNPVEHALGTQVIGSNGKLYCYVRAPAAIAGGNNVTITWGTIDAASIATKTTLNWICPTAAFAAGDYGWVENVRHMGTLPPGPYTGSGS